MVNTPGTPALPSTPGCLGGSGDDVSHPPPDVRTAALQLAEQRPDWTASRIAKDLGVPESRISKYLAGVDGLAERLVAFGPMRRWIEQRMAERPEERKLAIEDEKVAWLREYDALAPELKARLKNRLKIEDNRRA